MTEYAHIFDQADALAAHVAAADAHHRATADTTVIAAARLRIRLSK